MGRSRRVLMRFICVAMGINCTATSRTRMFWRGFKFWSLSVKCSIEPLHCPFHVENEDLRCTDKIIHVLLEYIELYLHLHLWEYFTVHADTELFVLPKTKLLPPNNWTQWKNLILQNVTQENFMSDRSSLQRHSDKTFDDTIIFLLFPRFFIYLHTITLLFKLYSQKVISPNPLT